MMPNGEVPPSVMTVEEVARFLRVTVRAVHYYIRTVKQLKAYKTSKTLKINLEEAVRFAKWRELNHPAA